MKAWIVRDVHFAVHAGDGAVPLQHHRGVVAQARCPTFKQADHQHHTQIPGQFAVKLRRGAGNRLRQIMQGDILALAEIGTGLEFLADHQLGAAFGHPAHRRFGGLAHDLLLTAPALLQQTHPHGPPSRRLGGHRWVQHPYGQRNTSAGICIVAQCREPCCSSSAVQSRGRTLQPGQAWLQAAAAAPSRAGSS